MRYRRRKCVNCNNTFVYRVCEKKRFCCRECAGEYRHKQIKEMRIKANKNKEFISKEGFYKLLTNGGYAKWCKLFNNCENVNAYCTSK